MVEVGLGLNRYSVNILNTLAVSFIMAALILWATPLWFPVLVEILFRFKRFRRMQLTEWLNASGIGIVLGSICYGCGRLLLHNIR